MVRALVISCRRLNCCSYAQLHNFSHRWFPGYHALHLPLYTVTLEFTLVLDKHEICVAGHQKTIINFKENKTGCMLTCTCLMWIVKILISCQWTSVMTVGSNKNPDFDNF